MRKFIAIAVLSLLATLASAKDNYDLKLTVLDTKNITSEHGSLHVSWGGSWGSGAWAHRVTEHVFAQCSNGMTMELAPEKDKNMLLPGEYSARVAKNDVVVEVPKGKGFSTVKLKVIEAHPTVETPVAAVPTPTAPVTQSPEEAAKRAQQYADCLKVAVNNPSIVCKP